MLKLNLGHYKNGD